MKTILAPIDFSSVTESVLAAAIELARSVKGRIVLLHNVRPPVLMAEYTAEIERQNILLAEKMATEEGRELERRRKKLELSGIETEVALTFGSVVADILVQAARLHADYIVMGSHGHTALYELFAGSTTSGVLKKAKCPVLVIPPDARLIRE